MTVFQDFSQLDDEDTFIDIVTTHYVGAFRDFAEYADCEPQIDVSRLKFAHGEYIQNINQFVVMLDSENPDQYKRSGALLHALYQSDPVTEVTFDDGMLNELEMNQQVWRKLRGQQIQDRCCGIL